MDHQEHVVASAAPGHAEPDPPKKNGSEAGRSASRVRDSFGRQTLSQALAAARALQRRVVHGDRYAGYQLAQGITSYLAPDYVFMESGRAWTNDEQFMAAYRRVVDDPVMRLADKKWFLRELARWSRGVDGDIAECGSFRGASAYFLAEATGGTGKRLHLFDSWQGLPPPVGADGSAWKAGDLTASEAECLATLAPFATRVDSYRGWIPDRFAEVEDRTFSLVHVDVDLYEPHRDALRFFWPRLADGGVMVFDDYGSSYCPGARQAVDEYFGPRGLYVIGVPTGQGFLFKQPGS